MPRQAVADETQTYTYTIEVTAEEAKFLIRQTERWIDRMRTDPDRAKIVAMWHRMKRAVPASAR